MPAKSERQRRAFGAALAIKRGKATLKAGTPSARIAKSAGTKSIRDFASKPIARLRKVRTG